MPFSSPFFLHTLLTFILPSFFPTLLLSFFLTAAVSPIPVHRIFTDGCFVGSWFWKKLNLPSRERKYPFLMFCDFPRSISFILANAFRDRLHPCRFPSLTMLAFNACDEVFYCTNKVILLSSVEALVRKTVVTFLTLVKVSVVFYPSKRHSLTNKYELKKNSHIRSLVLTTPRAQTGWGLW